MPLYYAYSVGLHGAMGRTDEAIEEFHGAVELDPNIGLAYFHAGLAFAHRKMIDRAIAAFERSRVLATHAGWAESGLGMLRVALGQKEEAKRILDELLQQKGGT